MTEDELLEEQARPVPGHRPKGESPEEPEPEVEKKPAVDPERARERAELKRERARRIEAEKGMQFWADKAANGGSEKPAKPAKEVEEEDDKPLSIDLVEALTSGNRKQIKAAFKEMGFVQKAEVDRDIDAKIGHTKAQIAHEQKLYKAYPELEDEESPLFEKTREIYQDLAKDPTMAKSPKLVEVAARMAKAELRDDETEEKPRTRRTRREEPEDEDEPEYEEDRQERVRSQQGSRGRRATAPLREESDELNSMQKSIVEKFRAAGADIDEAKYRERAKRGVQVSGLPGRRR